jgi:MFS family permease
MTMAAAAETRAEFRLGWPLVLASMVGFACGSSGLVFYTSSVFVTALKKDFHWSMAALQSGPLVTGVLALVLSPTSGWLVDRFGTRRVAIPSMIAFCLCFMAMSLQNGQYRVFLMLWALLSISGAGTLSLVWSRAISGWFDAGRGTALGAAMLGTGLTAMAAPPLTAWLIHLGGWRFAYRALGGGALVLSLPLLLLFLKDRPPTRTAASAPLSGLGVGEALRDWRFWLIGFCLFGVTFTVAGVISNLVKLLTAEGFSTAHAAGVAGFIGLFVILGRMSCGALMDRAHAPYVAAGFFAAAPIACVLLTLGGAQSVPVLIAAALTGLGAAAEFDVAPFLLCRYLGLKNLGSILGLVMVFWSVGAALAPAIFGHSFDVYASYKPVLWFGAGLSALSALGLLLLGPYPEFRAEPLNVATPI